MPRANAWRRPDSHVSHQRHTRGKFISLVLDRNLKMPWCNYYRDREGRISGHQMEAKFSLSFSSGKFSTISMGMF